MLYNNNSLLYPFKSVNTIFASAKILTGSQTPRLGILIAEQLPNIWKDLSAVQRNFPLTFLQKPLAKRVVLW